MSKPEQTDAEKYLATIDPYLLESVQIMPEAIMDEYQRIPADLAYWNARYAEAVREQLAAKHSCELIHAQLLGQVRDALISAGAKSTEAQVDAGVEMQPAYIAARERVTEAEAAKATAFGHVDAVRSKRDMLISIGAHLRVEMEGDPMIRERFSSRHHTQG